MSRTTITSKTTLAVLVLAAVSAVPAAAQTLDGCAVFPSNNVWNTPIDTLPVHSSSPAWVSTIGSTRGLHPDFSNAGGYGIPFITVPQGQAKVAVSFQYADESDPGPYPIPANAPIEGGPSSTGDRHVLVMERGTCILYELYSASKQPDGSWQAGSGAKFELALNKLRTAGWTSADAAGFAILPGLIRYDEVASGEIKHAIRMTAPQTKREYIWPARHYASSLTGTQYPPMGVRFRLKANFDISPYPADVQVILRALKKYGAFLADNGSAWYLSGAPDTRWNDDTLHTLGQVLGSNFEAVDESSLMVDPDSGAVSLTTALSSVQLNPSQMIGGSSGSAHSVVLSGPAPAGGATVTLQTSNAAVAPVPPSAFVPAGASSVTFTISTTSVFSSTPVTISALYLGVTKMATLTVNPAGLTAFSISPSSVTGGVNATGTVSIGGPAPSGGAAVSISTSSSGVASAQQTVTILAGQTSANFTITTSAVASAQPVTFTASYGGGNRTANLTVNPAVLSGFTISPSSVTEGSNATGTVSLNGKAPSGGAVVGISSSNPSAASALPPTTGTVTIPAGQTSASFTIATGDVASNTTVAFTATYNGATRNANLTVNRRKGRR
jgi:hypothetical protein